MSLVKQVKGGKSDDDEGMQAYMTWKRKMFRGELRVKSKFPLVNRFLNVGNQEGLQVELTAYERFTNRSEQSSVHL